MKYRKREENMKKPLVLCILDGCGIRKETDGNAFANANKPTLNMLFEKYPTSILEASGKAVGLPEGQMGTSEVGHMNLGSGRVAMQPLENITSQIENGEILNNERILEVLNHVKENNSNLHLFGLLEMCKKNNIENVYIDACLDGRDTYEKSALTYLDQLQAKIDELGIGKINVITGRYYGMDRDNNFDRLKLAYDALVYGEAKEYNNYKDLVEENYNKGVYDEFLIPGIINKAPLQDNDGIIAFNFR